MDDEVAVGRSAGDLGRVDGGVPSGAGWTGSDSVWPRACVRHVVFLDRWRHELRYAPRSVGVGCPRRRLGSRLAIPSSRNVRASSNWSPGTVMVGAAIQLAKTG